VARQVALVRIGLAVALLVWAPAAFDPKTASAVAGAAVPFVWLVAGVGLALGVFARASAVALAFLVAFGLSPLPFQPVTWMVTASALGLLVLSGRPGAVAPPADRGAAASARTDFAAQALRMLVSLSWLGLAVATGVGLRIGSVGVAASLGTAGAVLVAAGLWLRRFRPGAFVLGAALALIPREANALAGVPAALTAALVWSGVLFLDEPERSRLVVWDDRCSLCRPRVALLRRLDWLRLHRFEGASNPEALRELGLTLDEVNREMRLRDGPQVHGGFEALRRVLMFLPAGFFWAPAFSLPPLKWLGASVYRYVAGHW
jgi:predicted DCC family thiol-disulfide oxidoreductase YuxK